MKCFSIQKLLTKASAARCPRTQWLLPALLACVLSTGFLNAQDKNAMPQTNDLSEAQDLGMGDDNALGDNPQADEMSQTNGVAPTNESVAPEPDGRSRRLYRQRSRSRGYSQSNGLSSSTSPGTNNGPASLDYSAFRMVAEKNIFDPNRRGSRPDTGPAPRAADSFTLVGTMSYEKGTFAFFDGTRSDYRKAARLDDVIAGYKVAEVTPDSVKLAQGTNVVQLSMGAQMRRRDDGSWQRLDASAANYAASSGPQAPTSSADSTSSGPESDVIKKLMLRREKE